MKIRKLDSGLARKIAAGEVIERPASVVKELLENALDAKSESISIELHDGGIRAITIRDDGEGMDEQDILLCAQSHTTSKIASEDDLSRISTLGFRGEALASIAAVSRLRIVSRPSSQQTAYEISVNGGEIGPVTASSRAAGTTVEVSDLFYNLPARASFLSSSRSEFFHCNRVIHRLALCCANVGFSLKHDERVIFSAPTTADLRDRIGQLYGSKIARQMIPIAAEKGDIRVAGYISSPEIRRGNRRDQIICINRRTIDDPQISYLLQNAYRGILRPGVFPLAVIQISIPASQIDVNIHPRKLEVKLADRNSVHGLLNHALKTALASRYVLPTLSGNPEQPRPQITINSPQHPQLDLEHARSIKYQEAEAQKVRVKTDRRAIGQLQQTYILVESPDGLEIIDQHIAHERILYEKLLKQVQEGQVAQQRFLLPVRVELPFESVSTLIEERETLMGVGIEIDDFGGGTLLIRSYPSLLVRNQVQYGFKELLEKLVDALEQGTTLKEVLFDHLVAELACGGAIKAGHRLSLDEQQELVDRLLTMDNPYTCPHGRPITFAISRHDLDKKFKRA